jgi:predicted nucleotidyltransferase
MKIDALIVSHRHGLQALAQQYGLGELLLFGSMARGDATSESDVDLLVDNSAHLTGFQLGALQMDAQDLLGRRVDVLTINSIHPLLRERVMSEAISLL